jgi:hypothetical protein
MVLISILIMTILQYDCVNPETVQHDFKVSNDQVVDLAASETCLISSLYNTSKIVCIGSCNSNLECRTVVYDQTKGIVSGIIYFLSYSDDKFITFIDIFIAINFYLK